MKRPSIILSALAIGTAAVLVILSGLTLWSPQTPVVEAAQTAPSAALQHDTGALRTQSAVERKGYSCGVQPAAIAAQPLDETGQAAADVQFTSLLTSEQYAPQAAVCCAWYYWCDYYACYYTESCWYC